MLESGSNPDLDLGLDLDPDLAEAAIARSMAYANLQDNANARLELARADSLTAEMTDERRRLLAQLRLSRIPNSRFYAMGDSLRDRMSRQEPDNFYVLESLAENAEASGDPLAAIAIWERILPLEDAVYAQPVRDYRARTKIALKMQGVIESTVMRPPLQAVTDSDDAIAAALRTAGLA